MPKKEIIIPIFPLDGVIFFPQSSLPLNIFEERYLEMINFSLKTNRLVGMMQSDNNGNLYTIGCVGKINSFSETADGRYVVNLMGQNYFTIKKKLSDLKKFVSAEIEIIKPNKKNKNSEHINFNKMILIQKYKKYTENLNIEIDFSIIEEIKTEELIKFIAMSCSFSKEDKQMLLETYDINEIGNKLISLFDFYPIDRNAKNSLN